MGGGGSTAAKKDKEVNKEAEKVMAQAEEADSSKIKLLLLGAGESGKSTIFKQMKILYGDPTMSPDDMMLVRSIIHNNLITTMQTLCEYCETFGYKDEMSEDESDAFGKMEEADETDDLTDEIGQCLKVLWHAEPIQKTWDRRDEFQVIESLKYYFEHVDRIATTEYMDNTRTDYTKAEMDQFQKDALYARVRTSGIVTEKYLIDGTTFEMYDVGGQRNERRKWIHCFEDVTAVIFVAAISEYDQKLFEDGATNRMVEALELFEEIVGNRCFMRSTMILFLNKRDLFEEKIKKTPINSVEKFSDYTGGQDFTAGCKYFEDKFVEKHHEKCGNDAVLYKHVTCATDTENVKIVMDATKRTILDRNFEGLGLL